MSMYLNLQQTDTVCVRVCVCVCVCDYRVRTSDMVIVFIRVAQLSVNVFFVTGGYKAFPCCVVQST